MIKLEKGSWAQWLDISFIRKFNQGLGLIVLFVITLFLLDFIFMSPSARWKRIQISIEKSASGGTSALMDLAKAREKETPLDQYLSAVSSKPIFGAQAKQAQVAKADSSLNNLVLVGIIPGATPKAMLEDTLTEKTYTLSKNETVNGITLEDIKDKSVTLKFKSEKIELSI